MIHTYNSKSFTCLTVKFLNFWTHTNCTVDSLRFKLKVSTLARHFKIRQAEYRIANSEVPDQTAPIGAC